VARKWIGNRKIWVEKLNLSGHPEDHKGGISSESKEAGERDNLKISS